MTELIAAERVATGAVSGPLAYGNSWLLALRISGVGAAYRASRDEFAWREPAAWLSATMMRRCLGLPIVVEHPDSGMLDGQSFRDTVIGVVVWTFVRGDELWAIGRFFDGDVAESITGPQGRFTVDTSPSVLFAEGETAAVPLDDGRKLLVEGAPSLIDHLALVVTDDGTAGGVWSKGRDAGIDKNKSKETTDGRQG